MSPLMEDEMEDVLDDDEEVLEEEPRIIIEQ